MNKDKIFILTKRTEFDLTVVGAYRSLEGAAKGVLEDGEEVDDDQAHIVAELQGEGYYINDDAISYHADATIIED